MLLLLRLAVLPFFIAAVVHVSRRFAPGDWRMGVAAGWALGLALVSGVAMLAGAGLPLDRGEAGLLVFKLAGLVPLAGALWVVIYSGMLLGDQQGGYWVKAGGRTREAVLWGGAAVLGLLALNWAVCRLVALDLNPAPTGLAAWSKTLTHLAFSVDEEFFYRGSMQAFLVMWLARLRGGRGWAIAIASVLFTVQHVVPLAHLVGFIFPAGVVFGVLFMRFGIWTAATTHFVANLVMTFILPRLV